MYKIVAFEENFAKEYYSKIENATIEQIEAAEKMFREKKLPEIMTIDGDTANISVTGPLSRKGPSFLDMFFGFGGTSYNNIIESIQSVKDNESIKKIVFHLDTPGGEAIGPEEVGKTIAGCGKKTLAINHGMIASAGYWIAAACDKIKAIESSSLIGSIGVVITAVDYSKMYEEYGIKVVQVVSKNAPDKRPDIKKKSGLEVLQNEVDAIENVFMSNIAKWRNTTLENVRENYGRGALLVAQNPDGPDAIKHGMIDGMIENEYLISEESKDFDDIDSSAVVENINTPSTGEKTEETMDLHEFLAQNPDAKAKYEADILAAKTEGVEAGKAEMQKRINATVNYIGNVNYPGIESLAKEVLEGKAEVSALQGAVAAFDMMSEKTKSNAAVEDTLKIGDTPPEDHKATNPEKIESVEDAEARLQMITGGTE